MIFKQRARGAFPLMAKMAELDVLLSSIIFVAHSYSQPQGRVCLHLQAPNFPPCGLHSLGGSLQLAHPNPRLLDRPFAPPQNWPNGQNSGPTDHFLSVWVNFLSVSKNFSPKKSTMKIVPRFSGKRPFIWVLPLRALLWAKIAFNPTRPRSRPAVE